MERREFIKKGVLGAVALSSVGLVAGCAPKAQGDAPEEDLATTGNAPAAPAPAAPAASKSAADNRVCQLLGIEKPVMQASMTFLTDANLCAAVSNAGGLGTLGTNAGNQDPVEDVVASMRAEVQKVKSLTDKPFAVNYNGTPGYLEMLQEEGVNIVYLLGMGSADNDYMVDENTIKTLKDAGMTVIFRDVNCTVDAMVTAQNAGADIVIASGYGNGGHMSETRVTLPSILAEAQGKITVPLMASGCIATGSVARALAAMGVEGAYCGTRFLASKESPCSDAAKQVIVDTRAEDLVEFVGALGFVHTTNTPASQRWVEMSNAGTERMDMAGAYQPMFRAMLVGNIDEYAVNMSDCVNSIDSILSCQEIVDEISSGFVA